MSRFSIKDFGGDRCGIKTTEVNEHGDVVMVKSYCLWKDLFRRCYSNKKQSVAPTYIGCNICNEWLKYSNFKSWYDDNFVDGFDLDKDILVQGNKTYGPLFCRFVPARINTLLIDCGNARGNLPQGVCFIKGKYVARIRKHGERCRIGSFKSPQEAYSAYKIEKERYVKEVASKYFSKGMIDHDIYNALMSWSL